MLGLMFFNTFQNLRTRQLLKPTPKCCCLSRSLFLIMSIFLLCFIASFYLMTRDTSFPGLLVAASSNSNVQPARPSFMLTTGKGISLFNSAQTKTQLISGLMHAVYLDYLHLSVPDSVAVYWTDAQENKIYMAFLANQKLENITAIAQHGIFSIGGLSVDWISRNLYWIDNQLNQIEVCQWDGSLRSTLLDQVFNVSGFVIDSLQGYLFWISETPSQPDRLFTIERSLLDGSQRHYIFQSSETTKGYRSLALLAERQEIYWIESQTGTLHSSNYDGLQHKILGRSSGLTTVFSFLVTTDSIFWTDKVTHVLKKAASHQCNNSDVLTITHPKMYDVKFFYPKGNKPGVINMPCALNNGGCSHLCLRGSSQPTCKCPYGFQLDTDQKICIEHGAVLGFISEETPEQKMYFLDLKSSTRSVFLPLKIFSSQVLSYAIDPQKENVYRIQNESILRESMNGSSSENILKMGYLQPQYLAVDWYHGNLYVMSRRNSSAGVISVCGQNGDHLTHLHWKQLWEPYQLALDPLQFCLFWSHTRIGDNNTLEHILETSELDGSSRKVLALSGNPFQSITTDSTGKQLCWLNPTENAVFCKGYEVNAPTRLLRLMHNGLITVLAISQGSLFYGDSFGSLRTLTLSSKNVNSSEILKSSFNHTFLIVFTPENVTVLPSLDNKSQDPLCLVNSHTGYSCSKRKVDPYLLYMDTDGPHSLFHDQLDHDQPDLFPSSLFKLSSGDLLDAMYSENLFLVWLDKDKRGMYSVRTDGKMKAKLVEFNEVAEGIAVDWIAENVYWSVPKKGQIWVSRQNGKHPYIVFSDHLSRPNILSVKANLGYLFWASCSGTCKIMRSTLSGSHVRVVAENLQPISDIVVEETYLYWSSPTVGLIERSNLEGLNRETLVNSSKFSPLSLAVNSKELYWSDRKYKGGSVFKLHNSKVTVLKNISNIQQLLIISAQALKGETGKNPCLVENGGCSQLCLFQGLDTNPVDYCFCSHGRLAANGKDCQGYSSFLLLSNRNKLESVNVDTPHDPNPPAPMVMPSPEMNNLVALAFDTSRKRIIFSDLYQKPYLFSIELDGTRLRPELSETSRIRHIEGLAFSSENRHLYWTESTFPSVWALTHNKSDKQILALKKGDKPRGIVFHPCSKRLFWTNWNPANPRIDTCNYGNCLSSHKVFLETKLEHPNALTLHEDLLFWSDSSEKTEEYSITSCKLDGTNLRVHINGRNSNPFGLVVLPNQHILWTDFQNGILCKANKQNPSGCQPVRRGLEKPLGLVVIGPHHASAGCQNDFSIGAYSTETSGDLVIGSNGTKLLSHNMDLFNNSVETENKFFDLHNNLLTSVGTGALIIFCISAVVCLHLIRRKYCRHENRCFPANIQSKKCYSPLQFPGSQSSVLTQSSLELVDVTSLDDQQKLILHQ